MRYHSLKSCGTIELCLELSNPVLIITLTIEALQANEIDEKKVSRLFARALNS
jgi:hypothetical protein